MIPIINRVLYQDAHLAMDFARIEVRVNGRAMTITGNSWNVLACLVRHPGVALSLETINKEVWGSYLPGVNNVKWHIHMIREALGFSVDGPIVTIRGHGYRYDPGWIPEEG